MLTNKKFLIGGLLILVIGVILFIVFAQRLSEKPILKLSLEEMAEKIVRENLKEEFLPSNYVYKITPYSEIVAKFQKGETTSAPLPPFSGEVADLYLTAWAHENVWFTSYIGYDKTSGDFIGYDISARVKEPELKRIELAQEFFKEVPSGSILNQWRHGKSLILDVKRELYSIVYKKGGSKIYLESKITEYPKPSEVYWPERALVKKIGIVWMEVFTSSNPGYTGVEQTQEMIMGAYNEE